MDGTCIRELIELGLVCSNSSSNGSFILTSFGQEVVHFSNDVHVGLLEAVCNKLDLRWHGRLAAAYVQTGKIFF